MSDFKKFILISISIFSIYLILLFQQDITGFLNSFSINPSSLIDTKPSKQEVVVLEEQDAVIKVVEETAPAVVSIVRKEIFFDPFRGPFRSEDSIGTGFIIDGKAGIILTNKHVVDNTGATYSVVLGEGEVSYDVDRIYKDPINDFAILKVQFEGSTDIPQIALGDSGSIKIGQTVIAIGNALGQFGNSVTKGIISGLGRGIVAKSGVFGRAESLKDIIQTDAALNPGNSGGPLLNLNGEVIGINVAISQGAENIGFSIPIDVLKPVIDDFMTSGKISRPFLGVEYVQITKDLSEERSLPQGAFVRDVVAGSPADKAGIEPGDIIVEIAGIKLDDENSLVKVISGQDTDKEVGIIIDRNGKEERLKIKLKDLEG